MTRQERQALNELSKKVYGSSSKWYNTITNGFIMNGKKVYPTVEEIKTNMEALAEKMNKKTIEEIAADLGLPQQG